MIDHYSEAERMIRSGNITADAAATVHALLAIADTISSDAFVDYQGRPTITPNIKGDML